MGVPHTLRVSSACACNPRACTRLFVVVTVANTTDSSNVCGVIQTTELKLAATKLAARCREQPHRQLSTQATWYLSVYAEHKLCQFAATSRDFHRKGRSRFMCKEIMWANTFRPDGVSV